MKLTLEDKQLLLADPLRRSIVVLRALPLYQGRIAYDCVKVLLTEPNNLSILESALHLLVTKSRSTTLYYIGLIDASRIPDLILFPMYLLFD